MILVKFFERIAHSLCYHERPERIDHRRSFDMSDLHERFAHSRSFVLSDLRESLTAAHLILAIEK